MRSKTLQIMIKPFTPHVHSDPQRLTDLLLWAFDMMFLCSKGNRRSWNRFLQYFEEKGDDASDLSIQDARNILEHLRILDDLDEVGALLGLEETPPEILLFLEALITKVLGQKTTPYLSRQESRDVFSRVFRIRPESPLHDELIQELEASGVLVKSRVKEGYHFVPFVLEHVLDAARMFKV